MNTQVWFIDGQLITNNPAAFAKSFHLPATAPVDGLSRISQRTREIPSETQGSQGVATLSLAGRGWNMSKKYAIRNKRRRERRRLFEYLSTKRPVKPRLAAPNVFTKRKGGKRHGS